MLGGIVSYGHRAPSWGTIHVRPSARSTPVKLVCNDVSVTFGHETTKELESGIVMPSVQFGPLELMKEVLPTRLWLDEIGRKDAS